MVHHRSLVLPIAIVLALLFHEFSVSVEGSIPYIIFTILLINFCSVNIKKLHFEPLFIWIMIFQGVVSIALYYLFKGLNVNEIVAQGVFVGVLCPVAAAVVVVASMLGANRETVTSYSILGNLLVTLVAPFYFSFIGVNQDMPFLESFLLILKKVAPTIALPFFIAAFFQFCLPKVNNFIKRYDYVSFYIWAVALFFTLGQTCHAIFTDGRGELSSIIGLSIASAVACLIQFGFGKWLGSKFGDSIAGGQLLGQKNTAMGIWLANHFINPLSSVYFAFYSIWQNLFNSWQLWKCDNKHVNEKSKK